MPDYKEVPIVEPKAPQPGVDSHQPEAPKSPDEIRAAQEAAEQGRPDEAIRTMAGEGGDQQTDHEQHNPNAGHEPQDRLEGDIQADPANDELSRNSEQFPGHIPQDKGKKDNAQIFQESMVWMYEFPENVNLQIAALSQHAAAENFTPAQVRDELAKIVNHNKLPLSQKQGELLFGDEYVEFLASGGPGEVMASALQDHHPSETKIEDFVAGKTPEELEQVRQQAAQTLEAGLKADGDKMSPEERQEAEGILEGLKKDPNMRVQDDKPGFKRVGNHMKIAWREARKHSKYAVFTPFAFAGLLAYRAFKSVST